MSFGNNNRGYQSVGDRYDQQNTAYGGQGYNGGYGDQRPYNARAQDVELGEYNDRKVSLLQQCTDVNTAIDQLDRQLDDLDRVFRQSLARPDMPSGEIDRLSADIMTVYRSLVERVKKIKSDPQSGNSMNASQVGRTDRRLKATMQKYQTLEASFRKESQAAAERQYRIVRPDASDAEVREAVSDPNAPIFQQALLSSDRRGQASSTLRNVKERHEAIQHIERQMVELAELFQDLDRIVQEQEPLVQDIEAKGEEMITNVTEGNKQINTAIDSARARNRKKWWCLLIVVILIIIIAVIVAVVVTINKPKN